MRVYKGLGASLAALVSIGSFAASCSSSEDTPSGGRGGRSGSGSGASSGSGGFGATGGFGASGGFVASGGSSATGGTSGSTGGSLGAGGTLGNGGTNGSGGAGATGGVIGDGGPIDADFGYDAPTGKADACASETVGAEQVPLDIYVMYDQSTSMTCLAGSSTRWGVVTPAFESFLSSPQAKDIGVGIQYFGQGGDCNTALYSNPDVPIATLPGNLNALRSSLQAHGAIGINLTTTNAALTGAIERARAWKQSHSTHAVVVLLVTDGQPNACGTAQDVVNTARTGASGANGIRTFVLGIVAGAGNCGFDPNPPNVNDLNSVAAAGGTQQAYIVDPGTGNATQQLLNALGAIRGTAALPCQYVVPKPGGGLPDTSKVTVTFTNAGGSPQTIPKVTDQAACGAAGGGWHFDNNQNPQAIILCGATCDAVKSNVNARVDVTVGCIRG